MIKIALTGGMGTGKTFISKHFIDMGIPVYYADEETKNLYKTQEIKEIIKNKIGESCFTNNELDFQKISLFIFNDIENRKQFETLIHPLVMEKFENWASKQNCNAVMMESAIIFEADLSHYFDKIIVVDAPLETRIARILNRSPQLSEEKVKQRIASQMSQEEKCARADFVILND